MALVGSPGRRRRWLLALAAVLIGLGVVAWRGWRRQGADPLARGVAAYERGDWGVAASSARQRLNTRDDDAEALRLLARSSARLGREKSARALFSRLGPAALQAEDLYLLGAGLMRRGMTREAGEVWQKALRADSNHPETLAALARLWTDRVRPVEAAELAGRLSRQPGWEVRGDLLLGPLLGELNDPAGAAEALQRAFRRDPAAAGDPHASAPLRKILARCLLRVGKPAEAREPLLAVAGSGTDPEVDWLLSRADLQEGKLTAAAASLRRAGPYRREHPLDHEPAPYVGEARCAGCHRAIHRAAQESRHAKTLRRGTDLDDLPLPARPVADPGDPRVSHAIERSSQGLRVETRAEGQVLRMLVEFAFGADDRYLSLVGRDDRGDHRLFRLSYHRNEDRGGWDRTTGQSARPDRPADFLGKALDSPHAMYKCLSCHTTSPRSVQRRTGPESSDRAIGCERCHGPGGNHLRAVAGQFPDPAIAAPTLASASAVTTLCGDCHGHHEADLALPRTDPYWLRFQATTLPWSRCYTESGGGMSCVTCHDPHRDAETSAASYEAKCLECHAARKAAPAAHLAAPSSPSGGSAPDPSARTACPVSPAKDCLGCHMPSVRIPLYHHSITDHYIRVPGPTPSGESRGAGKPRPVPHG